MNKNKDIYTVEKIKKYGETILNNVIKEIKIYINK